MGEGMRSAWEFLRDWRASAWRAYRPQYGIYLALPMVWGCLEAYAFPRAAALGFLAMALFLERRPGRRLAVQAALFVAWTCWLNLRMPGDLPGPPVPSAASVPACGDAQPAGAGSRAGSPPPAGNILLAGMVAGFPTQAGRLAFLLETGQGRYRVQARGSDFAVRPGQCLEVAGRYLETEPPTNPGQFDYPRFLLSQGIRGQFQAAALRLLEDPGPWDRALAGARDALQAALARTVPPDQLPLFEAALLGNTATLDPAVMEDFRASGMLHILAISGQHVGILALILLRIFSLLRLPRKAAFLATGLLVAFYVPVCGASISVVRSALMYGCLLPAILWERPSRGLNNLALAACLCLLWMPGQILSLGFQLSFGATFFLLLYSRPITLSLARLRLSEPWKGAAGYAWPTLALSAVIFLGLLPVLSASTHVLSPMSVAGNLATVGLSSGMIIAGCLALLAGPVPLLGPCFGETAGLLAALLAEAVRLLARLPGSSLPAAGLPPAWGILLLLLLLALPFALRRRRGLLLALLGAALFSGRWAAQAAWDLARRPVTVAFLDVGQGDATVLHLPGADILIDAGPAGAGRDDVLPYLRSRGVRRLDLALITHPDLDHYGGLAEAASHLRIGRAVGTGDEAEARAWKGLRTELDRRGIPWAEARAGQYLYRYGDISLEVLSPARKGRFRGRNDNSLVCLLRAGKDRVLLTGDMEREAQAWLLSHGPPDLRGAVLKVPHHGSDRTTDLAFLEALAPEAAVVSAGRRNRYGHPGPGNLETLRRTGSRLFQTPRHGAVIYRRDRSGIRWETFLGPGRDGAALEPAARSAGGAAARSTGGAAAGAEARE